MSDPQLVRRFERVGDLPREQQGFIERTQRGRMATANAYRRFGITPPPAGGQAALFDG